MELKIRENQHGKYIVIHTNDFEKGIQFAFKNTLEQIQLRGAYGSDVQTVDFKLFDTLSRQLKILSLGDLNNPATRIESLDAIYNLEILNNLYIQEKIGFPIDVSKFKNLQTLGVAWSGEIINPGKALNLEKLVISSGYSNNDLSDLQELQSLRKLHIYKSPKLQNLAGIKRLPNLQELKLAFNTGLKEISSISDAPLKKLHVEKCKDITDLSFLHGNNSIEELFVTELDSIQFVKTMKKLEKIHFWSCKDGDMAPLFENNALKQAFITTDRKHYSHKKSEITKYLESNRS